MVLRLDAGVEVVKKNHAVGFGMTGTQVVCLGLLGSPSDPFTRFRRMGSTEDGKITQKLPYLEDRFFVSLVLLA